MRPSGTSTLAGLGFGLSGELWIVQAGIFISYLGYGAVLPFEVLYLHEGRAFDLGVAGIIVGTSTGLAAIGSPLAGPLIDRFGARTTGAAGLLALAGGYVGLAVAITPMQALAAAAVVGIGNGTLQPSQSALLASMVPSGLRHRASAVTRVGSNLGFAVGGILGGIVATQGLSGYIALLIGNAFTYLLFAVILVAGVRAMARPPALRGGYRLVLRDRPFVRLALINVAAIAVGWGVFSWIVPTYVAAYIGLSTSVIGWMVVANAMTVVVAQVPAARLAEGKRRAVTIAAGALLFVPACLLVLAAGPIGPTLGAAALVVAAVIVGLGECLHTTVLMPLVADLAPVSIRGRYMAAMGLSWWLGLALAPTLGTQLMSMWAPAAMWAAAAVALTAAVSAMWLEHALPMDVRMTPRPDPIVGATGGPTTPRRRQA